MKNAIKFIDKALGKKAEFYLGKVQQVANIGFWELNVTTGKIWWSDKIYNIFQFDPSKGPPSVEKCIARIHPDDLEKTMSVRANAIEKGQAYALKVRIIREDGSIRHLLNEADVQVDENGKAICVFGIIQDITDRVHSEQILAEQNMKISNQSHLVAIGEVARGIAHEINNPLAIIVGKIGRMKVQIQNENPLSNLIKDIDVIERAAMRASKIISSLRGISDVKQISRLVRTDINEILKTTFLLCNEKISSQGIQLQTSIQDDVFVMADQSELVQVFLTLLNNAFDAVVGTQHAWIKFEVFQDEHSDVVISVTDSGQMIPPSIADKLMIPFFTTKPVGQGIGLSLSMAKNIVENHGGIIKLDRSCKNTRFVIRLPDTGGSILVPVSIDEAIEAHLKWKQRLLNYSLKPDGSLDPKTIRRDDLCSLGKWIYHPKNNFSKVPLFYELRDTHKKFHEYTASLVEKINNGEDVSSEIAFSEMSPYSKLSKEVVSLLESLRVANLKKSG